MDWGRRIAVPAATIGVVLLGAAPARADDAGYLQYLNSHGYTGLYAGGEPIPPVSARTLGHMICEDLHTSRTVEQLAPHYPSWPQFPLMAEAAQHELCPDTLR